MKCNSKPTVTPNVSGCGRIATTCNVPVAKVSITDLVTIYYPPFAQKKNNKLISLGDCVFGAYNPIYNRNTVLRPKKESHQHLVSNAKLYDLLDRLNVKLKNSSFNTFEDVFDAVASCNVFNSSSLVVYDVALRIAFWISTPQLNLLPNSKVYLHRGAMIGAKALFKGKNVRLSRATNKGIFTTHFPQLANMTAYDIENFLCIFKDNL